MMKASSKPRTKRRRQARRPPPSPIVRVMAAIHKELPKKRFRDDESSEIASIAFAEFCKDRSPRVQSQNPNWSLESVQDFLLKKWKTSSESVRRRYIDRSKGDVPAQSHTAKKRRKKAPTATKKTKETSVLQQIPPKAPPIFKDGVYRRPLGRPPRNCQWNAQLGVWILMPSAESGDFWTPRTEKLEIISEGVYKEPSEKLPQGTWRWMADMGIWMKQTKPGTQKQNGTRKPKGSTSKKKAKTTPPKKKVKVNKATSTHPRRQSAPQDATKVIAASSVLPKNPKGAPKSAPRRLQNGLYQRPKGRAPKGCVWDGSKGNWEKEEAPKAVATFDPSRFRSVFETLAVVEPRKQLQQKKTSSSKPLNHAVATHERATGRSKKPAQNFFTVQSRNWKGNKKAPPPRQTAPPQPLTLDDEMSENLPVREIIFPVTEDPPRRGTTETDLVDTPLGKVVASLPQEPGGGHVQTEEEKAPRGIASLQETIAKVPVCGKCSACRTTQDCGQCRMCVAGVAAWSAISFCTRRVCENAGSAKVPEEDQNDLSDVESLSAHSGPIDDAASIGVHSAVSRRTAAWSVASKRLWPSSRKKPTAMLTGADLALRVRDSYKEYEDEDGMMDSVAETHFGEQAE